MADVPTPPARYDRAALERVLARASELQAQANDQPEGLTESQLVELAREVGLSADHVARALAEERTRTLASPDDGLGRRLLGPARTETERVVAGAPDEVLAQLDGWMQRKQHLRVKRRLPDRIVWEPDGSVTTMLTVGVEQAFGGERFPFSGAFEVGAHAVALGDGQTLVRMFADVRTARTSYAWGGASVGGTLAVAGVALAVLGVLLPVAAIPAVLAPVAGLGIARLYRGALAKAALGLEQVLDRLAAGELRKPPTLLETLKKVALPPGA